MPHDSPSSARSGAEISWTEIEDLLDYLAERASEAVPPEEFFRDLLNQAVPALAAVAGAVWTFNPQGQLELIHQLHLSQTEIGASEDALEAHGELLRKAVKESAAFSVPPGSVSDKGQRNGQPDNPTDHLILFAPIKSDEDVVGLLEIFQRPRTTPAAQQGFLRFLETLSEIAGDFTRRQELRNLRDRSDLWGQYEAFAERVHSDLDLDKTAFVLANEGRGIIGCDRVGVLLVKGRRNCKLKSISGQDTFDRRANPVRLLEQLCSAVVETGEPFWYHEDAGEMPPQIEAPLERYLDESHARMLAVVPLKDPEDPEAPFARRRTFGALVAERFTADPTPETTRHRVEAVAGHGAAAIRNALTHRDMPFFTLLKSLQRAAWYTRLKNLPRTLLVLGLIAGAVCALIVIPADFTVSGEGELQPEIRRDVFSWSDGVVENVLVAHREEVKAGDIVAEMRHTDLDFEISRIKGEELTARARLATIGQLKPAAKDQQQFRQLSAEEGEIKELIKSLERQLEILSQKQTELKIKSPITGQVLTWDVRQLLDNRPVSRGQILLTVADLSGPWVVEIRVPDDQIGHVLKAQKERGEDLPVEFLLATDPETTYTGKITKISMHTEPGQDEAAFVLVTVSINRDEIPDLRPGATVIPKISCGEKPVGYVWFHGLIDAVKTYVLF
jgi:multidrug efflux pump subunit AcrA (membrane-fusion protein)